MRLPQSRHYLMSRFVRARNEVHCSGTVTELLLEFRAAVLASDRSAPVQFVEVGAGFGDCMLAAASLLPAGKFRGIAFEPVPVMAASMKDTMWINGLDASIPNQSSVEVRSVAVSNTSALTRIAVGAGEDGEDGIVKMATSTLDAELASLEAPVDLLTIMVNSLYLRVLVGARRMLRLSKIKCILINGNTNLDEERGSYESFLMSMGYRRCGDFAWSAVSFISCKFCCPRKGGSPTCQKLDEFHGAS